MPKKSDKPSEDLDKVLDILDDPKKPSRRQRQKIVAEVVVVPSKLEKAKANALDLFSEDGKTKVRKPPTAAEKDVKDISKILDHSSEDPNFIKGSDIASVAASTPAYSGSGESESDDPKLIVIKPPILVPDLAARLGLKPFNVMADLIKLGVFPAPNQPLEPDIAAKVCEIHGFTFEREKRDKDKGFHKVEEVIVEPEAPQSEPEDLLKVRDRKSVV